MDLMKEGILAPQRLVNLRTVRGLDGIEEDRETGGMRLGPLVTLARLAADPGVRRRYRALADAAGHAATPQIRNVATLGGNLLQRPRCWYFRAEAFPCRRKGGTSCFAIEGENAYHAIFANGACAIVHPSATATALVALGARLSVAGPSGPREVKLESIFVRPEQDVTREHGLTPNEVVTAVRLPPLPPGAASAYAKLGEKESFDWPIAEVACVLERAGVDARGRRWCWARRRRCPGARRRRRQSSPARSSARRRRARRRRRRCAGRRRCRGTRTRWRCSRWSCGGRSSPR